MPRKPLKILMLTGFPCIRALKESQALKRKGHSITLVSTTRSNNPAWENITDDIFIYHSPTELVLILKKIIDDYDIVHGHNEPNWHIALAILNIENHPIIYDCHDFTSLYADIDQNELLYEKICFEKSSAVIHVSNELCLQGEKKYNQNKSLVLYSLPSVKDLHIQWRKKLPGIHVAYEGCLSDDKVSDFNFRYYIEYFQEIADSNATVHVYPSEVVTHNVYMNYLKADREKNTIRVYASQKYDQLLRNISAASWGFTGFYRAADEINAKSVYLDHAMPNKLFEYLYSGLTPVVINCKEAARFVKEHNIGYHAHNIKEFIDIIHHAPPLAQNMNPEIIDMDTQIIHLENLYYDVLG